MKISLLIIFIRIDRVETIYIPTTQAGLNDPNELRYLRIFQNNDLTSNFYLSYTYDVTRTLQSWIDGPPLSPFNRSFDSKYTWNNYLIEPMMEQLHETDSQFWILPVIHGFCGQGNVNVFGRHVYITLVARRSRHYAGTRYLKRGISTRGYVANEVETEQIVFENPTLALKIPNEKNLATDGIALCSSFVQVRGSVPALWTQDISMSMVGPPPISCNFNCFIFLINSLEFIFSVCSRFGNAIEWSTFFPTACTLRSSNSCTGFGED